MTVNNPIEAEKLWREGKPCARCACLMARPLAYPTKVAGPRSWADLPTCLSAGIPVQYLMMRGIFTSAGATPEQVAYYNEVLDKVRALPEWAELMARGAFNQTTMRGDAYAQWLDRTDRFHRVLMREAKFKAPPAGLAAAASAPLAAPVKK
jgi:putative tricarboxylic transport membrane protein